MVFIKKHLNQKKTERLQVSCIATTEIEYVPNKNNVRIGLRTFKRFQFSR